MNQLSDVQSTLLAAAIVVLLAGIVLLCAFASNAAALRRDRRQYPPMNAGQAWRETEIDQLEALFYAPSAPDPQRKKR